MKNFKFTKINEPSGTAIAETMRQARPVAAVPLKSYGPHQIGDIVTFIASFPQAKSVCIAGDFNGWNPQKNPMTKKGDDWQTTIRLEKGTYQYRYVVDGVWQQDPTNNITQTNPYGGLNSVLKVS